MAQFDFGSGLMIGTPLTHIDGTTVTAPSPVEFGIMQDVALDVDMPIRELHGTFMFPVALGRGKAKISAKARLAQINANLWGTLMFGQLSMPATGQNQIAYREAHTIPATPYTVTVTNSASFIRDLGVRYQATGLSLAEVASGPTTGQYSFSAGVYTFAAADTTLGVFISYEYTLTSGYKLAIANQLMGQIVTFQASFQGVWSGKTITIDLNNCVSDKLSFPTKLDDFIIHEFDFEAFADANNNLMTISMQEQ